MELSSAAVALVFCLAVAVPGSLGQTTDFANNFESCVTTNNVPLNTCLNNTLEELRAFMPTGIPSINVQKMEPLEIPMLDFSNKKREGALNLLPLNVSVQFRNVSGSLFAFTLFNEQGFESFDDKHGYFPLLRSSPAASQVSTPTISMQTSPAE